MVFGLRRAKVWAIIVRAISFQDFQPMWSLVLVHQRYRQTDGRHATAIPWPLCTIVHRAVKTAKLRTLFAATVSDISRKKYTNVCDRPPILSFKT